MHQRRFSNRGLSLIEMMLTCTILAIVVGAAIPSLGAWISTQRLKGVAQELATDLQYARSEAVWRNGGVRISFHGDRTVAAACYIVHTGPASRCSCDASGHSQCSTGEPPLKSVSLASVHGVRLQANVASLLFSPEHGTASPTASLRLTSPDGRTVQHTVNLMGRVRSCVSQGAVSGLRAC